MAMLAVRLVGMQFRRDGPSIRGLIDAHLDPLPAHHRPDRGDGRLALRDRNARTPTHPAGPPPLTRFPPRPSVVAARRADALSREPRCPPAGAHAPTTSSP